MDDAQLDRLPEMPAEELARLVRKHEAALEAALRSEMRASIGVEIYAGLVLHLRAVLDEVARRLEASARSSPDPVDPDASGTGGRRTVLPLRPRRGS